MRLIVLGAPGAGKGTQARRVSEIFELPHISTGDMLRDHMRRKTEIGESVAATMNSGGLVPDELVIALVKARIECADCEVGFILDGFPRNIKQAEELDRYLVSVDKQLDKAVNLHVPDETIIGRMLGRVVCPKCGAMYNTNSNNPKKEGLCDTCSVKLVSRPDDNPETFARRLRLYHDLTEPIIDFYQKQGMLITVKGEGEANEITKQITKLITN